MKLSWNDQLAALRPTGRLHSVGATLEPLGLGVFPLIMGQRSLSGSPVGSPATIASMLELAFHHDVTPVIQTYPMD